MPRALTLCAPGQYSPGHGSHPGVEPEVAEGRGQAPAVLLEAPVVPGRRLRLVPDVVDDEGFLGVGHRPAAGGPDQRFEAVRRRRPRRGREAREPGVPAAEDGHRATTVGRPAAPRRPRRRWPAGPARARARARRPRRRRPPGPGGAARAHPAVPLNQGVRCSITTTARSSSRRPRGTWRVTAATTSRTATSTVPDLEPGRERRDREELPGGVPGLAQPVGVHQQPVPGQPPQRGLDVPVRRPAQAEAQRQPRRQLGHGRITRPHQLWPRVAGAHQLQRLGLGHLHEESRHELLVVEEPGEVLVHLLGDLDQGLAHRRGLPEGADHPGRLLDAGDPLASDVPDEQPDVVVGVVAVVEVAADEGAACGGLVQRGDRDVAGPLRQHRQDRPLGDLGDLGDLGEAALAVHPDGGDRDRGGADQGDVDDADVVLRGAERVVPDPEHDGRGHGEDGDDGGPAGRHDCAGDQRGQPEHRGQDGVVGRDRQSSTTSSTSTSIARAAPTSCVRSRVMAVLSVPSPSRSPGADALRPAW